MSERKVSLVITDLDNTLYDWFSQWYHSFSALLDQLEEDSGISRDVLIPEIKAIHQKHGTAEYSFLIGELPSLRSKFGDINLVEKFDTAIYAHRKARKRHLRLYPGVLATLKSLKRRGCVIVGYTESMGFYSNYRVRQLELDGILDYLYSPPDHDLPQGMTAEQIRKYPAERYELKNTIHRFTPEGELKPNPRLLLDIIDEVGGLPSRTLYVGDNLWKDVQMAQDAGVIDVHANYGAAHQREEYDLLVQVTHWTDEDVATEQELKAHDVNAGTILGKHFDQLLDKFEFIPFGEENLLLSSDAINQQIEIWKKTVDVQQHFNEIEMKIRNLALTFLAALVGAVGFSLKEKPKITLEGQEIDLPGILLFAALFIWFFFWFMDRHWYHRLLYGAVQQGLRIEKKLKVLGFEASLTDSIGDESPIKLWGRKVRSPNKIDFFYYSIGALILVGVSLILNVWTGVFSAAVAVALFIFLFRKLEKLPINKNDT